MNYIVIFLCLVLPQIASALEYKEFSASSDSSEISVCDIRIENPEKIQKLDFILDPIVDFQLSNCHDKSPTPLIIKLGNNQIAALKDKPEQLKEAYQIRVAEKIEVTAQSRAAIIHALNNIYQHLQASTSIKKGTYYDYPDYQWRGLVSRLNYLPCGDVKKIRSESAWLGCQESYLQKLSKSHINKLGIYSPHFYKMGSLKFELVKKFMLLGKKYEIEIYPVLDGKLASIPEEWLPTDALEGIPQVARFRRKGNNLIAEDVEGLLLDERFDDTTRVALRSRAAGWAGCSNKATPCAYLELDKNDKIDLRYKGLKIDKNKTGQPITVTAQSDYEIGIEARAPKAQAQMSLYIEQFDENNKLIFGYTFNPKIRLSDKSTISWSSLFTSPLAKTIAINLIPMGFDVAKATFEIQGVYLASVKHEMINVHDNDETFPTVYSQAGTQYVREKDYQFEGSKIRELFDWRWERLPRGEFSVPASSNIREGEVVTIKYDRVPLMFKSVPMTKLSAASKYTYQFYHDVFKSLAELNVKYIHLAMDEHRGGYNRDSRSLARNESNAQALARYISDLEALANSRGKVCLDSNHCWNGIGSDVQIIIWDDMFNPYHNGSNPHYQAPAGGKVERTGLDVIKNTNLLSNTIILNSWWYDHNDKKGIISNAGNYYNKNQYSFISSVWKDKQVIKDWIMRYDEKHMLGMDGTVWSENETPPIAAIGCSGWSRKKIDQCLQ